MKEKKKIYFILVPIVLFVWILIIYRVISVVYPENETAQLAVSHEQKDLTVKNTNQYQVTGDYRDPFLPVVYIKKSKSSGIKITPKVVVPKVIKAWPKVEYLGSVSTNSSTHDQLLYIKIDGKNRYMKTGETKDGLKLLKITKDSVEVDFMGERKFIYSKSKLNKKK